MKIILKEFTNSFCYPIKSIIEGKDLDIKVIVSFHE
jgi:hypothetical protein